MSPYVQRAWKLLFMMLPPMNEVLIKLMDSFQWTYAMGIICPIEDIGKNDSQVAQVVKKKKKKSAYSAEDPGLIPALGGSPGVENDNPLQYSYLENPMNRGAWLQTMGL